MFQLTNFYLSDYFFELKSQVDSEMAEKYLEQTDANLAQLIKNTWIKMIQTIETFERECIQNKQSTDANEIIDSIETKLNGSSNIDLKQLNLLIQAEEYRIQKNLFPSIPSRG